MDTYWPQSRWILEEKMQQLTHKSKKKEEEDHYYDERSYCERDNSTTFRTKDSVSLILIYVIINKVIIMEVCLTNYLFCCSQMINKIFDKDTTTKVG